MKLVIGASFSHTHLAERGIPYDVAWEAYRELGLPWIRLGCYWSEIEEQPGIFDFSLMHRFLQLCEKRNLAVVMTVGMKAPRWPEYYLPDWLKKKLSWEKDQAVAGEEALSGPLFSFIEKAVLGLRGYTCISHWQVENEPLDPSGPGNNRITPELLAREAALIRQLDPDRPQVVNLWGNELKRRGYYREATRIAEVIGLDIYARVPFATIGNRVIYRGMADSESSIAAVILSLRKQGKTVWISELQAELWGKPESCTPKHMIENTRQALRLGVDGIFLWGFEYWLHEKLKGNPAYWEAAREAIGLIRRQR